MLCCSKGIWLCTVQRLWLQQVSAWHSSIARSPRLGPPTLHPSDQLYLAGPANIAASEYPRQMETVDQARKEHFGDS